MQRGVLLCCLKGKSVKSPMLSRNCIRERPGVATVSAESGDGKEPGSDERKPGDLPVSADIRTYEDRRC